MAGLDLQRVEEAGLNALQTQRQLFYDGWLLRLSPGKAKRARSVNAHFGSTLSLEEKIAYCEALYARHGLPLLFRMTPFSKPLNLERALESRGYVAFDPTLVQVAPLDDTPAPPTDGPVEWRPATAVEFVDAVAALRGSPAGQREAHLERLSATPLLMHARIGRQDGRIVAAGQIAIDQGMAGIFDVVTADAVRNRGLATSLCAGLLHWAQAQGARHAYLQVDAGNTPALAVYRKFGFVTAYRYHYRARPGECR